MPELPEVETIRKDLDIHLKNRRIAAVEILDLTVVTGHRASARHTAPEHLRKIIGQRIERVERLGKFLLLTLSSEKTLVISLRMTGQLLLGLAQPGARFRLHFKGETRVLSFLDTRRFGEIHLMNPSEVQAFRRRLGPDALETPDLRILGRRRAKVHSALMNQSLLAGVGNIYATEALFRAGIKPQKRVQFVPVKERQKLQQELRRVLVMGVRNKGCTFDSYRDLFNRKGRAQKYLQAYGRAGEPCVKCREELRFSKIGGRGVAWCPQCQH